MTDPRTNRVVSSIPSHGWRWPMPQESPHLRQSCSNGLDLAQRSFPSAMEIGSGTHTTWWLSDSGQPELQSIARIETETYAS
jgi:hypothetical protein